MIDLTLWTRTLADVRSRVQEVWTEGGILAAAADAIAWLQYTANRTARSLFGQFHAATADGIGPTGLAVESQPQDLTGINIARISGVDYGTHILQWDGAGKVRLNAWPWKDAPDVWGQIDLAPDTGLGASDLDDAVDGKHFWILIDKAKLPNRTVAEAVNVVPRLGIDFLNLFGMDRNRPRYSGEALGAYRRRLVNGVGRAVSAESIKREVADLLGYEPAIEERQEEWSGWLVPGLSCIGYGGSTLETRFVGPDKGYQDRYKGTHGRAASDAAKRIWIKVRTGDESRADLMEVINRSRAAGISAAAEGGL